MISDPLVILYAAAGLLGIGVAVWFWLARPARRATGVGASTIRIACLKLVLLIGPFAALGILIAFEIISFEEFRASHEVVQVFSVAMNGFVAYVLATIMLPTHKD